MKGLVLFAAFAAFALPARAANYTIDPDHSSVSFRIRHLVGHVTGQFDKFQGTFSYEKGNPKVWKASATIDAASIDTKVSQRDNHLRSEDFFNVKEYPALTFVSTKVAEAKGEHAKLIGKLTILETTKNVVLDLEIGGVEKGTDGREHAAFTAKTRINRKDFGLTWNDTVESGGVLVGDDVDITIEIEGVREK
ncbi:MAG TPA: YceI family protein [Elusimicrobiota bacterium]|jgi:polyisoprenoid-binding protein YceI|nr:YceI family protein [Elusimicrobiota bacterium]